MTKSLNRRHTMTKRSSIKLEALYSPNCLELDFGHLRANEIDTLLSPNAPEALISRSLPPTIDHVMIRLWPLLAPLFPERAIQAVPRFFFH
jgi:hypothetical protein